MSAYCRLARASLSHWLQHGKRIGPQPPIGQLAGCFVSLHDGANRLRGCIGTIEPVYDDLAREIAENAVAAGTRDPRFPPVSLEELAQLHIEVSVLLPPQRVADESELDPVKYGVIVQRGSRRGLLLPDIEGVDSVARQLEITRKKASIGADEPVTLWRFEVKKYAEHES